MSYEYLAPISRQNKMRAPQLPERDSSTSMQINRAQQHQVLTGLVAILWDMENCPVPSEVRADDVAANIRLALRLHPVIQGPVTLFSAYGDFNHFPRKVREGCQRTGVNLIDVPNRKKDASDKAILVDLFLFALDNPPPCTIFLISGDVDFAPALHKLGQRGYTVVLAIPSGVGVSSALCSAGRFVWDWPSVARGGGLVPAKNFSYRGSADDRMAEIIEMSGYAGSPSDDSDPASDDQIADDEEQIVWKSPTASRSVEPTVSDPVADLKLGPASVTPLVRLPVKSLEEERSAPQRGLACGTIPALYPTCSGKTTEAYQSTAKDLSSQATVSRETSAFVRGQSDSVTSSRGNLQNTTLLTGSLQCLREQLVKLLVLHGGKLEVVRVPAEYLRQYNRQLYLAEYGCTKLVHLLERFREWLTIKGEGVSKTLHLTKNHSRADPNLKRDIDCARCGEEMEQKDRAKIEAEHMGDAEDETTVDGGVASATEHLQAAVENAQTLVLGDPELRKTESITDELEKIRPRAYEWDLGSGGSGDEKDHGPQEEKDVEVDESTLEQVVQDGGNKGGLQIFRQELQELLVSHAYKIVMTSVVALYEQRYSRVLDYAKFGVQDLGSLIEKVKDVAIIMEEPDSNVKFLVANCGS